MNIPIDRVRIDYLACVEGKCMQCVRSSNPRIKGQQVQRAITACTVKICGLWLARPLDKRSPQHKARIEIWREHTPQPIERWLDPVDSALGIGADAPSVGTDKPDDDLEFFESDEF